jgi:hypothetical protein
VTGPRRRVITDVQLPELSSYTQQAYVEAAKNLAVHSNGGRPDMTFGYDPKGDIFYVTGPNSDQFYRYER